MLRNTVSSHVGCNVNYVQVTRACFAGGGTKCWVVAISMGVIFFWVIGPVLARGSNVENNPVAEEEAGFEEEGVMMRYRSMLAR